ncbi:acyltransferase family protein [Candidatus Binatus sp.]|uniref:acyltransferase family protein n=1 Tax=Candidatus Binatus sp. TaxID=2811406 RepID=UPI003BCF57E1
MSQAIQKSADALPEPTKRFYFPELDVLRFFAFFAVFVFHLPTLDDPFFYERYGALGSLGNSGAFGVDLFFTLSGYLITRLLLREREQTGDINLRAFYARRTLRIWPLYYFSLAFAFLLTRIPASIASAPPHLADVFAPMRLSTYFFMAIFLFNFNFANSLFYSPLPFMAHLWSISVEEQFYLFWPWFARYVPRRRIVVIPIVMLAVACITRATLPVKLGTLDWNNTFTRLDPIAVGILIALIPRLNPPPALRLALVLIGFASWLFASYYCGLPFQVSTLKVSMGFPAVALGSGAFLLATLGAKSLRSGSALVRRLIYLGKISYGLYVYNTIATLTGMLFLYRGAFGTLVAAGHPPWSALPIYILLAFGLNVALAAVSYRWLEAPFLRLKERFTRVPSRAV